MDHFEGIVKILLEHEGYWVRQSFKVNVTKQEKRDIGKHSIPRPEIDLLAYRPADNDIIAVEVKSLFDSPGFKVDELLEAHQVPQGRFKMFTCENYRSIVLSRLQQDLQECGMIDGKQNIRLGLAAGNIYQSRTAEIKEHFDENDWFFWSPEDIKEKVVSLAEKGYENEAAIITAKILMR